MWNGKVTDSQRWSHFCFYPEHRVTVSDQKRKPRRGSRRWRSQSMSENSDSFEPPTGAPTCRVSQLNVTFVTAQSTYSLRENNFYRKCPWKRLNFSTHANDGMNLVITYCGFWKCSIHCDIKMHQPVWGVGRFPSWVKFSGVYATTVLCFFTSPVKTHYLFETLRVRSSLGWQGGRGGALRSALLWRSLLLWLPHSRSRSAHLCL